MRHSTFVASLFIAAMAACTGPSDTRDCSEGKCDTPGGTVEQQCKSSRVSAMDSHRPHFTAGGVRWSCKDVAGVTPDGNTKDSRGQEYCEYFALLHTKGIPSLNDDFCDDKTPCAAGTCDLSINSCVTATSVDTSQPADILGKNTDNRNRVTGLDPKLTAPQIAWLGQHPDAKVGECVFTSWHNDIELPATSGTTIAGYSLNADVTGSSVPLFRMGVQFNSNGAARALAADCFSPGNKEISDGFMRGCTMCGDKPCVPWRKSDPSVCTFAMRAAECKCKINVKEADGSSRALDLSTPNDQEIAKELIVPMDRRGFTLGTWDGMSQLPTGCRYVKMGHSGTITVNGVTGADPNADQTLVACDLKAGHINTATAKDPKEACRTVYGDDIVVHVRAPSTDFATLSCDTSIPGCDVPWDFKNL